MAAPAIEGEQEPTFRQLAKSPKPSMLQLTTGFGQIAKIAMMSQPPSTFQKPGRHSFGSAPSVPDGRAADRRHRPPYRASCARRDPPSRLRFRPAVGRPLLQIGVGAPIAPLYRLIAKSTPQASRCSAT
jgi:hypothetical protein